MAFPGATVKKRNKMQRWEGEGEDGMDGNQEKLKSKTKNISIYICSLGREFFVGLF